MRRRSITFSLLTILLIVAASSAFATGDCIDYTDLTGQELPISVNGTTASASGDYGPFAEEPGCWQGTWDAYCAYSNDVTYKWTAPYDGLFTFTLMGSGSYADLLLYRFTCPAEPVYPADFLCGSHRSLMNCATIRELELTAGEEILVVVDGWVFWNGAFTLRIYDNSTLSDSVAMGMDLFNYPAMSAACAWSESGRWRDNFGLTNIDDGVPVEDHHLFNVWSISKTVTATALMQLWEDGLFDLDDDVNDHLPFQVRHPAYPDIPITIRMLMTHTSGIINSPGWHGFTMVPEGDPDVSPCEFMEDYVTPGGLYFNAELNFTLEPPGTVFVYGGGGATLMGCLVAALNPDGLSFEEYCRAHIFDPLQMPTSSFLYSNVDPANLVTYYVFNDPNYYAGVPYGSARHPANGLRSSGRELSRLMLAFLRGGELSGQRILDAATVDSMLTVQYPAVTTGRVGLIWWRQQIGDRWVWGHRGGGDPGRAGLWISRDEGLGVIAISNCGGSAYFNGSDDINDMEFRRAAEWAETGVGVPENLPETPALVRLGPCYPNPFNPQTTISLSFARDLRAEVGVYDLLGRSLCLLADREFTAGIHSLSWNGLDAVGRAMPSGTYIVRLETESGVEARKVSLIR